VLSKKELSILSYSLVIGSYLHCSFYCTCSSISVAESALAKLDTWRWTWCCTEEIYANTTFNSSVLFTAELLACVDWPARCHQSREVQIFICQPKSKSWWILFVDFIYLFVCLHIIVVQLCFLVRMLIFKIQIEQEIFLGNLSSSSLHISQVGGLSMNIASSSIYMTSDDISCTISCRQNVMFGHIAKSRKILPYHVNLAPSRPRSCKWQYPSGCSLCRWIHQVQKDDNNVEECHQMVIEEQCYIPL